jgi:hypothetical protein
MELLLWNLMPSFAIGLDTEQFIDLLGRAEVASALVAENSRMQNVPCLLPIGIFVAAVDLLFLALTPVVDLLFLAPTPVFVAFLWVRLPHGARKGGVYPPASGANHAGHELALDLGHVEKAFCGLAPRDAPVEIAYDPTLLVHRHGQRRSPCLRLVEQPSAVLTEATVLCIAMTPERHSSGKAPAAQITTSRRWDLAPVAPGVLPSARAMMYGGSGDLTSVAGT